MKKKCSLIFGLLILTLLSVQSCKTVKIAAEKEVLKDSIHTQVQVIPRDTIIDIPRVEVDLFISELNLSEDKPFIKQSAKKNAILTIKKDSTGISANCTCDSTKIAATLYENYVTTYHQKKQSIEVLKTLTVKKTPKFVGLLAWIGGGILLLIIIWLLVSILKKTLI